MDSITFRTTVSDDQVIRPPADVVLPRGTLQVTITPVTKATVSTASANARLRECRASLGCATGIDNRTIDADLARSYGPSKKAQP